MKYNETEKKEIRKKYFEEENKKRLCIRISAQERAVLQNMMIQDGWTNTSAFIKFKLFGFDLEEKVDEMIDSKDPQSIGRLLHNQLMELTSVYIYLRFRYDKDMNQLYREPGVDLQEWIKVTNCWHKALTEKTNDTFVLLRKIALKLDLDDFFISDVDAPKINLDKATKEELDALAEKIRAEQIALGLPNTFK